MTFHPIQRRQFLAGVTAGVGALWLSGSVAAIRGAAEHAARGKATDDYRVFTPEEAEVLEAMAEQIIPTDDMPGAKEARVVRFMDQSLATFAADQRLLFTRGIADLQSDVRHRFPEARSFASLEPAVQAELLHGLEAAGSDFFEAVRVATITGMFANPEYGGNFEKSGWRLIGFDDRFAWQAPFGDYDHE